MGGSKQTQTTSQTTNPYAPAVPLVNDIIGKTQNLGNQTDLFAPSVSGATMNGIQGLENLAGGQNAQQGYLPGFIDQLKGGFGAGQTALTASANGSMLGSNPYLDSVLKTAGQRTADQVNAQFSGAGRFGSGAHTGVLTDRIGQQETQARMQNYDAERTRQMQAAGLLQGEGALGAGMAGQLDQANLGQNGLMLQAGQMRDAIANAEKSAPLTATQWMAGLGFPAAGLGGSKEGTATSYTPPNYAGMAIGGLTSLGGLFGGQGPFGANGAFKGFFG